MHANLRHLLIATGLLASANTALAAYPDDLKLVSYNVMLAPRSFSPNEGQALRAQTIPAAPFMQNQDVVILQELFDNDTSTQLLNNLATRYPYQTPVIGRSGNGWDRTDGQWRSEKFEDGGVAIASRWPIVEKVQYLFQRDGCGDDWVNLKGFAYAKINVQGHYLHVIGTHTQSESSWGCDVVPGGHAAVRQAQFQEIANFIRARQIPSTEMVVIGGDLNVNRDNTTEYQTMLSTLNVTAPRYAGLRYGWDPSKNGLALDRYGNLTPEYLDYLLVDKDHLQPSTWHNLPLDTAVKQWTVVGRDNRTYAYTDTSDHFPLLAFGRADASTPTHSNTDLNGSYRQVTLQNLGSGKYVQADTAADGWLRADASTLSARSYFKLSNNYGMRDNGCIRSGDYVRIERSDQPNYFFTWYGTPGYHEYAYYTASGIKNAGSELRLINLSNASGCLKSGDVVAFKDFARQQDYYLTSWNGGWANDMLFLWMSSISPREQFRVVINEASTLTDWRDKLQY